MRLSWGSMTFPPINLWTAPSLTIIEYKEKRINGRQRYSSKIKPNPLYEQRKSG